MSADLQVAARQLTEAVEQTGCAVTRVDLEPWSRFGRATEPRLTIHAVPYSRNGFTGSEADVRAAVFAIYQAVIDIVEVLGFRWADHPDLRIGGSVIITPPTYGLQTGSREITPERRELLADAVIELRCHLPIEG